MSFLERLEILWVAIRCLFTGRATMYKGAKVSVGEAGLISEVWVKREGQSKWQHLHVWFDGKNTPKGYVDGVLINDK
jgi:hypothetical protein